ncbi:hypothetical protein [Shimia thalassica]|uniref:hypothetical protein n=1 Tax=Shimia thalassica TaxID=1715693 RepID=UPI0026E3E357|nr:hypothetical protein [Shimia thalassica]MDO6800020.1 hypothetical protein [Shimia thalassica]
MGTVFEDMLADNDRILVTVPTEAKVITFSNSGRGGKRNWFAMTTDQLRGCLEDMLEGLDAFPSVYEEKLWRELFKIHLTEDVARTMGAVQTLPLFEVLAKVIHYSNGSGPRSFKTINLAPNAVRQAIAMLERD